MVSSRWTISHLHFNKPIISAFLNDAMWHIYFRRAPSFLRRSARPPGPRPSGRWRPSHFSSGSPVYRGHLFACNLSAAELDLWAAPAIWQPVFQVTRKHSVPSANWAPKEGQHLAGAHQRHSLPPSDTHPSRHQCKAVRMCAQVFFNFWGKKEWYLVVALISLSV